MSADDKLDIPQGTLDLMFGRDLSCACRVIARDQRSPPSSS
jgi:hypothetical protein